MLQSEILRVSEIEISQCLPRKSPPSIKLSHVGCWVKVSGPTSLATRRISIAQIKSIEMLGKTAVTGITRMDPDHIKKGYPKLSKRFVGDFVWKSPVVKIREFLGLTTNLDQPPTHRNVVAHQGVVGPTANRYCTWGIKHGTSKHSAMHGSSRIGMWLVPRPPNPIHRISLFHQCEE